MGCKKSTYLGLLLILESKIPLDEQSPRAAASRAPHLVLVELWLALLVDNILPLVIQQRLQGTHGLTSLGTECRASGHHSTTVEAGRRAVRSIKLESMWKWPTPCGRKPGIDTKESPPLRGRQWRRCPRPP
jgi:hypothetical protein